MRSLLLAMLLLTAVSTGSLARGSVSWEIVLSEPVDLVLHVLAHMATGTAADNYDPGYIAGFAGQRPADEVVALRLSLEPFAPVFRADMSVWFVSVMPVFFETAPGFLDGLAYAGTGNDGYLEALTPVERALSQHARNVLGHRSGLVRDLAEIIRSEYGTFYAGYWRGAQDRLIADRAEFETFFVENGLPAVHDMFASEGIGSLRIVVSEAMRRNGRGYTYLQPTSLGAIIPLHGDPVTNYFVAVHELTHPIADPIVAEVLGFDPRMRSLDPTDPGYANHQILENAVMVANYWMFAAQGEAWDAAYRERFIAALTGMHLGGEHDVLATFRLPDPLGRLLAERFGR